ncbi:kinesin-like protein KIF27 [Anneissia japonica]|uniref:kinesin-like protein KIF27 n=1 Tax=Anneissia japonica TaxID=1529436 RepID=UPI001425771C|nr:kinesin-like protein KIF27 [Anneissia japonica]XP_033108905.1 kinesin-like protein KIF27 [Anneissia japonica]
MAQEVPVRVVVRVRPLLAKEKLHRHEQCVRVLSNSHQVVLGRDRAFTFDSVLGSKSTQEEVYSTCVEGLVSSLFEGYNATVFAYGQTGSGKTFTVGGGNYINITNDEYGIIPRAVQHIFNKIKSNENVEHTITVSYIEIYKEELRDLLDRETSSKDMHIREDEHANTVIIGAKETPCGSMEDVMSCLASGSSHRQTGSTNMNEHSSRSHAIFTIVLHQNWQDEDEKDRKPNKNHEDDVTYNHLRTSKFHFVDLAGSERAHRTGNAGERFKESVYINSGLLALGNVISALSDQKKKNAHIPYRDSKITRILKDSLGGNAKTCMITCISPSAVNFDETLNSLKYANRAKNIKNKPIVNQDVQSIRMEEMQTEIQALREELQRQKTAFGNAEQSGEDKERVLTLEKQMRSIKTTCAHFKVCTEEAKKIFMDLLNLQVVNKPQAGSIQNWMDLVEEANSHINSEQEESDQGSTRVAELESKLKKALADLASDEEIFAEKVKEANMLQERVEELEKSGLEMASFVEEAMERNRLQEEALVQQQIKIDELTELLRDLEDKERQNVSTIDPLPVSSRRAKSVPAHLIGRRRTTSESGASGPERPQSRRLHTSPPLFSLDRIVQGFRARSQVLVKRIEDDDEVLHQQFGGSLEDSSDDSEFSANNSPLGQTWSYKKTMKSAPGGTSRIGRKSKIPTGTMVLNDGLERSELDVDDLRTSTEQNEKKVRESQLRSNQAHQKMRELTLNIRLKEELIRELVKTGKESEAMNKMYTTKIKELEKESSLAKKDLMEAQHALQDLESRGQEETKQKQKLRSEYKKKMEEARNKMKLLEKKQQDTNKMVKIQTQSEKRAAELEVAIEKMKNHQELMQRRLKEENERKIKLERDLKQDQKRIKELEIRNSQQKKILRRKTEEIAAAHRKLRSAGGSTFTDEQLKVEEQKKWLDTEVEKVLERKKKVQELEIELQKREIILAKREAMIREKSQLEIKKLRSSTILSQDIHGLALKIKDADSAIEEKNQELRNSIDDSVAVKKGMLKALVQDRDKLVQQRSVLDEKLQLGSILSPHEERRLIELNEGIDALDAAIDYKNEIISNREEHLQANSLSQSESELMGRLGSLSTVETKALLARYFEKVVDLRESEKQKELEVNELEMKIDEQERLVRELDGALQRAEIEMDRKITEQQKQHQERVQFLMKQIEEQSGSSTPSLIDTKIKALEKDLYYYKKTSRDLKRKLREFIGSAASSLNQNGQDSDHQRGSDSVEQLLKDDQRRNLTPIRKSKREVRELSSAEVSMRWSSSSQAGNANINDSLESDHNP